MSTIEKPIGAIGLEYGTHGEQRLVPECLSSRTDGRRAMTCGHGFMSVSI